MSPQPLKAPFPWFGGKSRAAHLVWRRLGNVPNYIEPFAGSLAVLLRNPYGAPRYEVANDLDGFVANFWRAVAAAPEAVAYYADWPVDEVDLTARHRWLCELRRKRRFLGKMLTSPTYYNPRVAGYWVWGLSCWIGAGWCEGTWNGAHSPATRGRGMNACRPGIDNAKGVQSCTPEMQFSQSKGVHRTPLAARDGKRPKVSRPAGVHTAAPGPAVKRPHLMSGKGIHATTLAEPAPEPRPTIGEARAVSTQRPAIAAWKMVSGLHACHNEALLNWMLALQARLRYTRRTCGDWRRVLGKAVLTAALPCGILLDPPYSAEASRDMGIYREDSGSVAHDVRAWCLEHGADTRLRICLCGYEGEGHEELLAAGWDAEEWKASGGYGRLHGDRGGRSLENRHRERLYFSPGCLPRDHGLSLWTLAGAAPEPAPTPQPERSAE